MLPSPALGERLGEDVITLYVGTKRNKFIIHKQLICESCHFFEVAFTSSFKENLEGVMCLPEKRPEIISLFVSWLYPDRIPYHETEEHLLNMYNLHFFAEEIGEERLMDASMDAIQDEYQNLDIPISYEMLAKVYDNTTKSRLRLFAIDKFVHFQELGNLPVGRVDSRKDLAELWEITKGNFDLFYDIFTADPRFRDEWFEVDMCKYHQHGGGGCYSNARK
ncbi:uncharacterized protein BP5553_06271 [Venustampulla echinocandica]|uniref:BTB domain-containing protein n=1 Tax=Venustampulla echinocandica TaxID=2656787 RepID=A0A370TN21_9HELO|nr:uncharacterized protein BP5553_06271 [Venustampulla echinocandica]RDL36919.1 hypothetical protein BP5553_06271 [Venustampulla echinocandica]